MFAGTAPAWWLADQATVTRWEAPLTEVSTYAEDSGIADRLS